MDSIRVVRRTLKVEKFPYVQLVCTCTIETRNGSKFLLYNDFKTHIITVRSSTLSVAFNRL